MITKETAQYYIERNIDFGEPLPAEVERYLEEHPESQTYLNKMRMVASTLEQIEVKPPSPAIVDAVMETVYAHETKKQTIWHLYFVRPVMRLFKSVQNVLHEFQIDPVLSREAWPTVFATLSILLGVFIIPQVQNGNAQHFRATVEDKLTAITDEAYQKVESVAKQINEFATGIIRSVSGEKTEEKKEPGDDVGLKYIVPIQRTVWEDTVELI